MSPDEEEQMWWAIGQARQNRPVIAPGAEPRSALLSKLLRGGDAPDVAGPAYGDLDTQPMQQPDMEFPPSMAGKPQPPRAMPDLSGAEAPDVGVGALGYPNVPSLYKQLDSINGTPMDYSGVTAANRARMEGANTDQMAGLILQTLGGKRLAPAGAAIFKKALDTDPLRPNLADVGYFNEQTGDFVESPIMARNAKEKMIAGRIDALTKMQEKSDAQDLLKLNAQQLAEHRLALLKQGDRKLDETSLHNRAMEEIKSAMASGKSGPQLIKSLQSDHNEPVYITDGQYTNSKGGPLKGTVSTVADSNKKMEARLAAGQSMNQISRLKTEIEANKGAFGNEKAALINNMPPGVARANMERGLFTPEEMKVRAKVAARTYAIIHSLAGAALSAGEAGRLDMFLPQVTDTPEQLQAKLDAALEELKDAEWFRKGNSGAVGASTGPAGMPAATPAPPGAAAPNQNVPMAPPPPPPGVRVLQ
jgi:hypothetical protein